MVLTGLALLSLLYWLVYAALLVRSVRALPKVRPGQASEPAPAPRVSMVIAARDEAEHVEASLRSKLGERYPALEVVFVDDRSVDGTGDIAARMAAEDLRVKVARVDTLPAGWLGKVHAMARGVELATGEWLLFTDADVHFAPGTLEWVVDYAEARGLDHVSILPRVDGRGPLVEPALGAFFRVIVLGGRLFGVAEPRSSAAVGVGAFNLVRRSALERTEGLAWLKMEVADDMALGMLMKRAGGRSHVLVGRDAVALDFYPSYRALQRGVEKNGATVPFHVQLSVNLLLILLEGGILLGPAPLAGAGLVLAALASVGTARWLGLRAWPAVAPAVGMVLLAAAMIRSGALAMLRGGARWRDTFYSTAEIRAGIRMGIIPRAASEPADEG